MAGQNPNDILICDFCKSATLARINRQYPLGGLLGAAGAEPTALAALG